MTRRWIEPILRLAVLALRRGYEPIKAEPGTAVVFAVDGNWRHSWSVVRRSDGWDLLEGLADHPRALVSMDADAAWRAFFSFPPATKAQRSVEITGDRSLAAPILTSKSVMIREAIALGTAERH